MSDVRRALVVDDNVTNRLLARALLSRLGWTVDEAASGEEGLQMAAQQDFPLILLDISMPGLSGEETCIELRKLGKPMRIIAYTAHAAPEAFESFRSAGFDDVLVKPVTRDALLGVFGGLEGVEDMRTPGAAG